MERIGGALSEKLSDMEIVSLQEGEGPLCKELRLRALRDSPGVFPESVSEVAGRADDDWRRLCESMTPPSVQRMFIAKTGDRYLGSVYALIDRKDPSAGRIGGMWVDSAFRKQGIGEALFEAVRAWAEEVGFSKIKLWVDDDEGGRSPFMVDWAFDPPGCEMILGPGSTKTWQK